MRAPVGQWEHSEMLFLTQPLVSSVESSCVIYHAQGARPPRGVIFNVPRRPVLAHSFGTLLHQAEIWFITRCPQICGSWGRLYGEDVVYDVSSDMQLSHVCPSWSLSPFFGSCPLYLRSFPK